MYQVIARKYRPQTFHDVVNQEHVKTTLENAIAQNRIAHGYIFSGPARHRQDHRRAHSGPLPELYQRPHRDALRRVRQLPRNHRRRHRDVIEIDAASNRGINEMRELRENVRYQPARDRYKVFIVDEAHQITNEAFNALLKTIEEPPPWVVFVLCTTEAHKIPATIASRCQHFSFRSVDFDDLVARMAWICEQEGIEADPGSPGRPGAGRRRQRARFALGARPGHRLLRRQTRMPPKCARCWARSRWNRWSRSPRRWPIAIRARMLEVVDELERNGQNLQHFARELARYFRNLLVARIAGRRYAR